MGLHAAGTLVFEEELAAGANAVEKKRRSSRFDGRYQYL